MPLRMLSALLLGCITLTACAGPGAPAGLSGGGPAPAAVQPAVPKRLTIGILEEPKGWSSWTGATTAGGAHQPRWLVTRTLTTINNRGLV